MIISSEKRQAILFPQFLQPSRKIPGLSWIHLPVCPALHQENRSVDPLCPANGGAGRENLFFLRVIFRPHRLYRLLSPSVAFQISAQVGECAKRGGSASRKAFP